MFAAIRAAMRTPLARPPGRRKWFARLGPEWWAMAVYAVFAIAFFWSLLADAPGRAFPRRFDSEMFSPLIVGTIFAWPLAAVIMFVGAVLTGAMALAPEHSRGTMDALLMTPADHAKLARGRYWHCLAPWLRFFACLLPLYVLLAGSRIFVEVSNESGLEFWAISAACAFSNKGLLTVGLVVEGLRAGTLEWSAWGLFLGTVRLANDLSVLLLVFSMAFYISARARSSGRTLALSCVIVPLVLILVLAPHDMLLVAMLLIAAFGSFERGPSDVFFVAYGLLGVAAFLARWLLAWWLCRSACRNFERWATRDG